MLRALRFALIMMALPSALLGQQRDTRLALQKTAGEDEQIDLRPIRIAKWATLIAATGAAGYGFAENRRADREYEDIERECGATPALCAMDPATGSYTNLELEQRYQRVTERDDRARVALLAGQIGIAASVIMFIIDLPGTSTPDDIPYEPRPLRVGLGGDGRTLVGFHLVLPRL